MTTSTQMVECETHDEMAPVSEPASEAPKSAGEFRTESIAHALDEAYKRASMLQLTADEANALAQDFSDEAFRLGAGGDPDLIYIEHAYLRQRLNSVLGVGASVPIRRREWSEEFTYVKGGYRGIGVRIYVDLVLIVRGCVVGEAIGDSVYYPNNPKTNYSDALEAAKSNAFRRCCKEFGVGLQAWMKDWGDGWKQRNGKSLPSAKQQQQRAPQNRQQQQRGRGSRPPAKQQQQQVDEFKLPPEWPHTPQEQLLAWVGDLKPAAHFQAALGMFLNEPEVYQDLKRWGELCRQLHYMYHARLTHADDKRKAELEPVTRAIDDALGKLQLDEEAAGAWDKKTPTDEVAAP